MDNFTLALTVLITGFVVVFAVLILLIFIIKLYGTIVYKAQEKSKLKKEAALQAEKAEAEKAKAQAQPQQKAPAVSEGIPPQVVAAIAAAVDSLYGDGSCKIKSIKKLPQSRPVWSTAGLMDNTRPF